VTKYFVGLGHEQFPPDQLLEQAVAAEQAGFDGIGCSDHYQPWWEPGESGMAWVWLGAASQATKRVQIGSAVTAPVYRYHPALVAQAFATLECLAPGRSYLGLGSGESLNESPLGMDWPDGDEQLERLDEALQIITRLFDGEKLDFEGKHFRTKQAFLHTRPERRPPIYVSAFHPGAAELAARYGDGLWTLGDPEQAPPIIDRYREAAGEAGREPGEIIIQGTFSWAETDDAAFEGAQIWRATLPPEYYVEDFHDPAEMQRRAQEQISDDEFKQSAIVSSDPEVHVERIRELEELGATIVVLLNASGSAPVEALRVYGEQVLPKVRAGAAVGSG
jgi:coenzyme F420-dependent glucose-6-phosphate dehydrogenase